MDSFQVKIQVRRFFCDNADCPRRIFAERLPTIAQAWSRRTARLAESRCEIGVIAGGVGGARLCAQLACPAGVDDWAKRKGQTYGTLLVDHERGCVVDVLADRTPETLAAWLKDHPGVEIVTRDRKDRHTITNSRLYIA